MSRRNPAVIGRLVGPVRRVAGEARSRTCRGWLKLIQKPCLNNMFKVSVATSETCVDQTILCLLICRKKPPQLLVYVQLYPESISMEFQQLSSSVHFLSLFIDSFGRSLSCPHFSLFAPCLIDNISLRLVPFFLQ